MASSSTSKSRSSSSNRGGGGGGHGSRSAPSSRPGGGGARSGGRPGGSGAQRSGSSPSSRRGGGGSGGAGDSEKPNEEIKKPAGPSISERKQSAVNLIDAKPPEKKERPSDSRSGGPGQSRSLFTPISGKQPSRQQVWKRPVKPEPAPEPEEEPTASAEAAAESPVVEVTEDGKKLINLKPPIIVKDLSEAIGRKPFEIIKELMEQGIFANINQRVEPDLAEKICQKFGFTFHVERREKGAGVHKEEEKVEEPVQPEIHEEEELLERPPIVTIMGHVDHGKTSILDYIRKTRVVAGEAGGITQHIGAYKVQHGDKHVTFLDTPGHQAFTAMRARGANVTDIVVLVVAADDGIMPQTVEAINHAKAAGVAIIVAINKMDLPTANPDQVKAQLQEHGLAAEDWGGETITVPVSAHTGDGIDTLLEMIFLQSEILELQTPAKADPRGVVIEAQFEPGRGPTATIVVTHGYLKVGMPFICGKHWGKVKALIDDRGKTIKEAGPSDPAKVLGFNGLPEAGDQFVVMDNEKAVRTLSDERLEEKRTEDLMAPRRATLEDLFANAQDGRPTLQLVVKADVQGSLEAVVSSLKDIKTEKVTLDIIHAQAGAVSESDILLASASDAVIVGFNVKMESNAVAKAKAEGVQVKLYSIIYELIDQVKDAMLGLLSPEQREKPVGHAEVKEVFKLSRGTVAGCLVIEGKIDRNSRARVLRGKQSVYDGPISTLRRFKDDVKEVRLGLECGIKLGDYTEYEVGDVIECYSLESVQQTL